MVSNLNDISDSQLAGRMRNSDSAAFEEIFRRYYHTFHTFAKRILKDGSVAEDIVQNVFVKLWIRREQINPNLSLCNYLLVMTRNELFDYMRLRYNSLRRRVDNQTLNQFDSGESVYSDIYSREYYSIIDSVVDAMPTRRKEIFSLRYRQYLTNDEIARRLNISTRTVEEHINLAIKQIKRYISVIAIILILTI